MNRRVVLLIGVLACAGCGSASHPSAAPTPLRARPAARLDAETEWMRARAEEIDRMTPEARAALERAWLGDRKDLRAAEQLLLLNAPDRSVDEAERGRRMRTRREVIVWLIERHPEHFVLRAPLGQLSKRTADPWRDPDGYEAAAERWQEQTAKDNPPPGALENAAAFFRAADPARAEALLARAQRLYPGERNWNTALGRVYASTLAPRIPRETQLYPLNADLPATDPALVAQVRERLAATHDSDLLAATGLELLRMTEPELNATASELLQRAQAIDRESAAARVVDVQAQAEQARRVRELVKGKPRDSWPDAIAALPIDERLRAMVDFTRDAYLMAEYADWVAAHPPDAEQGRPENVATRRQSARDGWQQSKQWARQTLALADANRTNAASADASFHAHIALGINALRDGDHAEALRHLRLASTASQPKTANASAPFTLEDRFIKWLLEDGERETVVAYFEALAKSDPRARERLTRAADDLRNGIQPIDYFRGGSIYATRP
jgi:hypothetical protein